MKPIIIYAEVGAGKTTHAKALAGLLGAKGFVDDWTKGMPIPNDHIALTSEPTENAIDATGFLRQIRNMGFNKQSRTTFDFDEWISNPLFNVLGSTSEQSPAAGQAQAPNHPTSASPSAQEQDSPQSSVETQPFSGHPTCHPQPVPTPSHEALVGQYLALLNQAYNLLVK